jgi:hypothetical protein
MALVAQNIVAFPFAIENMRLVLEPTGAHVRYGLRDLGFAWFPSIAPAPKDERLHALGGGDQIFRTGESRRTLAL